VVDKTLWCSTCNRQIGSSKQDVDKHLNRDCHVNNLKKRDKVDDGAARTQKAIHDFKGILLAKGERPEGLERVRESVQLFRAEALECFLSAGVPSAKIDKMRGWIEHRAKMPLESAGHLISHYIEPLKIK
jgi:hypothetical protein